MSAPRLVTVLFTDLVASTETVARLGPEAGQAWRLGHIDLAHAGELVDACLVSTRAFGMAYLTEQAEALRARL